MKKSVTPTQPTRAANVIAPAVEVDIDEAPYPELYWRLTAYCVFQITKLMKPGDQITTDHAATARNFLFVAERDASLELTYAGRWATLRRMTETAA
jgi:hypothetical protein